ncbi:MAG TPA: RidA family protein [Mycobacteriales bacterium]|nr:RidA family protein [Mycobacteriales bacterium]
MTQSDDHPYTAAVAVGDVVFVSGALNVDAEGTVVPGRREALDAALETLRRRLATVDLDLEHVVKATYFVTDLTLRDEANAQFRERFGAPKPARTFVEVSRLPYGATVEIDAVARR